MNAKELIERYIQEVGRHLPRRQRDDILKELTSLIYDALESESGKGEPTAEMAAEVLREFGEPRRFAQQYQAQQALIGPQLFPTFKLVCSIMLMALTIASLVSLIALFSQQAPAFSATAVWAWFTDYLQMILFGLGSTTLIFAAIEYFAADELDESWAGESQKEKTAVWDPFSLPPIDDPNRISRGEFLTEIVANVFFLTLFLAFIGQGSFLAEIFIAPAFFANLGWLIASIGLEVMLKIFVLGQGSWTQLTRWLDIGSEIFGIYVLYRIISAEAIVIIEPLNNIIIFSLTIVILILVVVTLYKLFRLIFQRNPIPEVQMA